MGQSVNHTQFKDSPVGRIPVGWEVCKLNNVLNVIDSLHSTPKFVSQGYPMVRVTDIKEGNLKLDNSMQVSKDDYLKFTKRYKPIFGDIVLTRVGSYGVSSYVDTYQNFCLGQNTVVIHSKSLDEKFAYYLLNATVIKNQIENEVAGSGYKSLSLASINRLILPIPSKNEQKKIASILTSVDQVIGKTESEISKLQDLKKGMMQQLLTQGIGHTQFKDSPVGKIPMGWEVERLGEIAVFSQGIQVETGLQHYRPSNNRIRFLRISDYTVPDERPRFIDKQLSTKENVRKNDIVMVRYGAGFGMVCRGLSGVIANNLFTIKPDTKLETSFLYLVLNYPLFVNKIKSLSASSAMPALNFSSLSKIRIFIPPLAEQQKIADILTSIDDSIQQQQRELQQTQNLKKSLMQDLLTGKVRVKVD
ncbi:hypothetical protein CMK18_20500 [Candidatus Poribacteria bacterium]|nr:hypothetical protein [Candidatus Poribacteria bacterium]